MQHFIVANDKKGHQAGVDSIIKEISLEDSMGTTKTCSILNWNLNKTSLWSMDEVMRIFKPMFCQCGGIVNIIDPIPRQMRGITTGIPHKIEKEWGWAATTSNTHSPTLYEISVATYSGMPRFLVHPLEMKPSSGLLLRGPGPQTEAAPALGF